MLKAFFHRILIFFFKAHGFHLYDELWLFFVDLNVHDLTLLNDLVFIHGFVDKGCQLFGVEEASLVLLVIFMDALLGAVATVEILRTLNHSKIHLKVELLRRKIGIAVTPLIFIAWGRYS
jgi:hypothetical protein